MTSAAARASVSSISSSAVVEVQEVVGRGVGAGQYVQVEVLPPPCRAAALEPLAVAGVVDEDATHRLGGRGQEVPPAVPRPTRVVSDQAEVGLVDQRRGLEGVPRGLAPEPGGGQASQLAIDEREQFGRRAGLAARDRIHEPGGRPVRGVAERGHRNDSRPGSRFVGTWVVHATDLVHRAIAHIIRNIKCSAKESPGPR